MNEVTKLSGLWKLGQNMPLILACIGLGFVLCLAVFKIDCSGCKTTFVQTEKGALDSATVMSALDSLSAKIAGVQRPSVFITNVQGPVVDSSHDCWGSMPLTLVGVDTLSIDSVNSCKNIYRLIRLSRGTITDTSQLHALDSLRSLVVALLQHQRLSLLQRFGNAGNLFGDRPALGYEILGMLGSGFPSNVYAGVFAQAWIARYGVWLQALLALPDYVRSFVGAGVSYKF